MLKLVFKGDPKAVQSFRFTRTGRKYQPKEVIKWKEGIINQAKMQLPETWKLLEGPLEFSATYVFNATQAIRTNKRKMNILKSGGKIYKITKPDLTDNLPKGLVDALSGVVWVQDQQIAATGWSEKIYGLSPLTIVYIKRINEINEPEKQLAFNF
jgi:Holliday junction resolvase RusA-like endonuclease